MKSPQNTAASNILNKTVRGVWEMTAGYYFVFNSRNQAIFVEARLKERGFKVELVPTPGRLGKSCNYSLAAWGDLIEIKDIRDQIMGCRASIKGVYKAVRVGQFTDYKKVL
jgi:hypothetical protein